VSVTPGGALAVSRGGAVPDLATFLGATLGAGTAAMGAGPLASSALDTFLSARGGAQSPGSADPPGTFRDAAGILRDQNFNIVAAPTGPGLGAPVGGWGLRGAASGVTLDNPVMNTNAPADNAGLPRGFVPEGGGTAPSGWAQGFAPSSYGAPAPSPRGSGETLTDAAMRFLSTLGGPAANGDDLLTNRSFDDLLMGYPDLRLAVNEPLSNTQASKPNVAAPTVVVRDGQTWTVETYPSPYDLPADILAESRYGTTTPLLFSDESLTTTVEQMNLPSGSQVVVDSRTGIYTLYRPAPPDAATPTPTFSDTLAAMYGSLPAPQESPGQSAPAGSDVSEATGSIYNIIRIEQGPPAPPGNGAGSGSGTGGTPPVGSGAQGADAASEADRAGDAGANGGIDLPWRSQMDQWHQGVSTDGRWFPNVFKAINRDLWRAWGQQGGFERALTFLPIFAASAAITGPQWANDIPNIPTLLWHFGSLWNAGARIAAAGAVGGDEGRVSGVTPPSASDMIETLGDLVGALGFLAELVEGAQALRAVSEVDAALGAGEGAAGAGFGARGALNEGLKDVAATRTQSGGINLCAEGDSFGSHASSASGWSSGHFDVVVHGSADGFWTLAEGGERISLDAVVKAILENGWQPGQPIRLLACRTGADGGIAAQALADALGVQVVAPTTDVIAVSGGRIWLDMTETGEAGEWIPFEPGGGLQE
jgi:hypothetical protein